MPAAPPALPTWDQVTSDPRYQNLPGGERLGILDNYDALIKTTLGEGYNPDDVAPYLDAERQKIAAEGQGPISTAARSFMTGAGQVATGALQGLGTFGNDAATGIDQLTGYPGVGSAVVNQLIPGMAGYRAAAPYAEAAQQEIERTYAPDQRLNPISATIGGGAGQAVAMLPSMIAGPVGPLALGAMQGYQQGAEQATDLGIQNPFGRMALGAGFAGAEMFTERLGGIGSGPLKEGAQQMINRIAGKGLQTIASEAIEEPPTGVAQDAMSLGAGYLAGAEQAKLDPLMPTAPGYLERRGMEALGGAVGGTVFAGISKLAQPKMGATNPAQPTGAMPPPLPVDGALPTGNEGASDDEFTKLEQTFASVNERNVPADATGMIVGEAQDIAGSTPATGTNQESAIRNPESGIRNPEPTISNQAPVPSIDNIGTKFAPPQVRAVPVIPDSPLGVMDSLDFLNEMPIAIGRSGTGGELDWQETASIPKYYRPFIASEQGQPIDTVAQAAYEANLIPQPTADALMQRVQQDIGARRTYRVQSREQTRDMLAQEKQAVSFDKSQNKLERQPNAQPVPTDALVTGDRMTIDGEEVTVRAVESDEDGYPTKVVLEDGKRFGVQEFNPQTKTGLFVDEFQPRARAEGGSEGPFSKAGPQRGLGRGLGALLGTPPPAPKRGADQPLRLTRTMIDQVRALLPAAQRPVGMEEMLSRAENILNGDSNLEVRQTDPTTVPQALQLILSGANPTAIVNRWAEHRNQAVMGQTTAPTPFTEAAATNASSPRDSVMSAYAQLDRTGQGYVRIPDLARASGLPMADVREVLIDLSDRGAAYLTPADEPRNIPPADRSMLVVGPSGPSLYVTMTEQRNASRGAPRNLSYAGPQAVLSEEMRYGLETARAMAADGKTPEQIRAITGWFPGKYDGKMRFEIADNQAKWIYNDSRTKTALAEVSGFVIPLQRVLDHPALFEAYPEARTIRVQVNPELKDRGQFTTGEDGQPLIVLNDANNMSTLLHEVQHWIQRKEGFARGGNAGEFARGPMFSARARELASDLSQSLLGGVSGQLNEITSAIKYGDATELNGIAQKHGFPALPDAIQFLEAQDQKRTPFGQYQRLAGEIEARDVQARQDLTPAQRAATAPYSAENIAPDAAIVLYGDNGPQASMGRKPPGPSLIQRTVNRWSKATQAEAALTQVVNQPVSDQLEWIDAALTRLHDMYKKGMITRAERDSLEQRFGAERRQAENRVQNAQFAAAAAARATAAAQAIAPPVPIAQKISMAMLGGNPKLAAIIQQGVKAMQNFWNVALPANTRTIMFGNYVPSNRIYGDINPTTFEIRIHSRQNPVLTRGTVYHEVGHALHFIANKMLGRDPHDVQIIQPVLDFLKTTKSGARLNLAAANLQTKIDNRLKTIQKAEAALARWQADSRMISIKGPPPKVPDEVVLNEEQKFIQYLAEPHEQFARTVHAATVFLNGETLNTHAEPRWEKLMAFDEAETQRILQHVRAVFVQHLPAASAASAANAQLRPGGLQLSGRLGGNATDPNNLGSTNGSPGQAPGSPSLAAPGRAAGNDALTPSQAVPLREEFGGAFPGHVAFTNKAMTAWAEQTAAGMTAAQIETAAATGRYDHVQLPYILTQGLLKSEREVRTAKTQAERTRAQATLGRLRDQLNPQNSDAGQALVAQKLALAPMREMMPSLAVDEAVEKGQTAVIDPTVGGSVQPAVKGLQDLTNQASAEATDELTSELEAEDLDLEAEPSTPAEQSRADEEMIRLRQELTAGKNALTFLTATWQKILATFTAAGQNKGAMVKDQKARMAARLAARKAAGSVAGNRVQSRGAPAVGVTQPALPATAVEDGMFVIIDKGIDFDTWQTEMVKLLGAKFAPQINVDLFGKSVAAYEQDLAVSLANVKTRVKAKATKQGKGKPQQHKATAQTEEQKAQRVADNILTKIAETHSDPPIWKSPKAENPIRKLYREHVKAVAELAIKGQRGNPGWQEALATEQQAFAQSLQALKVPPGLANTLAQAANLEINAKAEVARAEEANKLREALEKLLKDSPALARMINQLRDSIMGGLNWKQIFTSTATQQRQWELDTYAAIRQHPALQNLNAEQAKNLTRELSKAWQTKRRTVWKRELNRTLIAAGMAKPKIRAKIEASAPRLLALINLGALDARTFRDAVAKEFGLKSMNDAEVGKIKEAAEKLQGLAPGTVPYRKAAQKFMEGLESLTNLSRAQLLESWWTASVLSGWRTQMDILFGVSNAMEDIGIGAVVGAIRTGNYGVASRAIFATIERAIQAVPEAFQMVVTGNRSLQASFDAEIRAHLEEGYPMMGQAGRQLMAKGGWRTGFGAFQVAMGRIMSALDHITSSGSRAGALWLARANHPEIFAAAVNITAQDRANARKQALQILTGGTEPTTTQLKQEVKRYTQELLDARHTLPDIEQQASDVGLQSSLQSDPTGLGFLAYELLRAVPQKMDTLADRAAKDNWVPTAVKLLRMGGQFSRVLFGTKFIRTAGNAITRSTNYVPGIGALNLMDGRSKIGSPAGDIILGKQLLGLVLFSGLLYAFRDREEDDDMGIEGGWKDLTADQRGQLLNQGKQPYSVWYRDAKGRIVSINYQQWSVANLLAAVGFTQDQRRYHGTDADAATVAQGLGYGLMTIADKAQLQGISTILGRDNNRSSSAYTVKGLNKWAAGLVGGMSPRLVKDIEDVIKPQLPRTDYWWQAWAREVPILRSQSSGARVDIFGREITIDRKPLSRIYQTGTVEPEYQILAKLNQRDVWISDPTLHPRKVKLSGSKESRDMTPLEKDRYAREAGKMTKDWLLQTGPQLLQMEPEQAQKMISQRTELIRAMALNRAVRR